MTASLPESPSLETIVNLAKRRGFVFPASEIYGGLRSSWDYGPLGAELLRNIKDEWWYSMVRSRDDVVGLDSAIIQERQVWQASGHEESFSDPLVECSHCNKRHRLDKLKDPNICPDCGSKGTFGEAREFNLMLQTYLGPVADAGALAYLRPETAQGIFINYENVRRTMRLKLPFGIAQVGKSFRNEITPGQFIFRTREFEQMEMEFFCRPAEAQRWHEYWLQERLQWYLDLGMNPDNVRLRPHEPDELAHYAAATSDVDFKYPWGWDELEGIANRTDFDLKAHSELSGQDLRYFDPEANERFYPYVIEPAAGATRAALAFMFDAYHEEEVRGEKRVVMRFHPKLAPIKVAVLPLSKKDELLADTEAVAGALRTRHNIEVDVTQSIGKRYRRQDEIGTPYAVTIDFDTLEDRAVTVRDRDSMEQERVSIDQIAAYLDARLRV
ncbi:MAG: glycine--tRNA ligase [Acidimicrobiia bacterium]|nr:glycine--tRNA ligase [Acidimicrobiia bacterium]NNL29177.1 glycine--tRNA ligase [Acidimicrobiia bacterium]